jgi:probable HAF family extracellular repeat protein
MVKNYQTKLSVILILFLVFQFLSVNIFAQQTTLIWIGTLGGDRSAALCVSDDGSVVVGRSNNGSGSYHAFMWTAAHGMRDLGTLGGDGSEATGISSDGSVIVGWSYDSSSIFRAFKWTVADSMQDLGAGDWSKASGVSADGSVITVNSNGQAYHWTLSGGLVNLGNLGGTSTFASAVSANGFVIVGYSNNSSGDPFAFRWDSVLKMEQIGTFYSFARGVSGDGSTVTGSETGSAGLHRAFRWKQVGGFEFNIAGNFSQGNAVSGDGSIIVGDNGGGAFRLSTAGGLEELSQVYSNLLSSGSELSAAWDISADGKYIVGSGLNGATSQEEGFLLTVAGITSAEESGNSPVSFVLDQNYPNPFNPVTTIHFDIPKASLVTLKVYNVLGQEVATLVDEMQGPGYKSIEFNSTSLPSGVYIYRLTAGTFTDIKKMILMK